MLPTVRKSYEGQYILGLEAIYRLLNMVFVGHVVCPVTGAPCQWHAKVAPPVPARQHRATHAEGGPGTPIIT